MAIALGMNTANNGYSKQQDAHEFFERLVEDLPPVIRASFSGMLTLALWATRRCRLRVLQGNSFAERNGKVAGSQLTVLGTLSTA